MWRSVPRVDGCWCHRLVCAELCPDDGVGACVCVLRRCAARQALNGYLHCLPSKDDEQRGHGHTAVRLRVACTKTAHCPCVHTCTLRHCRCSHNAHCRCSHNAYDSACAWVRCTGGTHCGVLPTPHSGISGTGRPDLPVVAGHGQAHGRAVPSSPARAATVPVASQPHYQWRTQAWSVFQPCSLHAVSTASWCWLLTYSCPFLCLP